MTSPSRNSVLTLMMALCAPALFAAPADQSELEALRERIVELEARVQRLESELASTDAALEAAKPPEVMPGGWRRQANWRVLEKGMEGFRVKEILGEPDNTRRARKFEYYEYGNGLVRFYLGRVKSWEVPDGLDPE